MGNQKKQKKKLQSKTTYIFVTPNEKIHVYVVYATPEIHSHNNHTQKKQMLPYFQEAS